MVPGCRESAPADPTGVPARPPTRACVVETGIPRIVAASTVSPAATAAAERNTGVRSVSGTSPLAENALTRPAARTMEAREPAAVEAVASASAFR